MSNQSMLSFLYPANIPALSDTSISTPLTNTSTSQGASPDPLSQTPIKIKTSRKWVLPPRPKPGRKPSQAVNSNVHSSKEPKEAKKSKQTPHAQHDLEASIMNNPLKQQILKINEENYYLKLEVIKLVSDLKNLKNEIRDRSKKNATLPAPSPSFPRKRSHDDDINDLIVSLIDLNHSQQVQQPAAPKTEEMDKFIKFDDRDMDFSSPALSEDDHLDLLDHHPEHEADLTPTPSISLTKTNETMDSLSGSTLVSLSPKGFKLAELPSSPGKDSVFSIFKSNTADSMLSPPTTDLALGLEPKNDLHFHDYYEFDSLHDVELEFENFINGELS
ncbi:hypothetical protein KL905_004517 [Ogataea polymorpha]|nr:uncharacterized protein OGAPODRAFT_17541 [Ogataea polymorpha]KAG7878044.1 hypothetical protein KL937_004191 [Ogataea polymorpha]KAG7887275.1 hypothetical protein KL936_004435 [Ogataea polymorpha]KAG7896531.1 hypothetical protein KL908_001045 [Ogataea polymorpha]KAG7906364.1 hypothetical protein KL906_004456 [Ogataea polymorpha]KAG7914395.1 hypothetical protein KL927_004589 [Ogataea polymorpha]